MRAIAIALTFSIACTAHTPAAPRMPSAAPDVPLQQACFLDGMGTIFAEFYFSCSAMACNRDLAMQIMLRQGIIASRQEFASTFGRTPILMRDVDRLYTLKFGDAGYDPARDQWVAGQYNSSDDGRGYIELERTGWPLLHELLHVYEIHYGRPGHDGWKERGYEDAAAEYVTRMKLPGSVSHCELE